MEITIEGVTRVNEKIWKAHIDPCDVRIFGDCGNSYGDFTVLLLLEGIDFDEKLHKMSFNPKKVYLLNVGITNEVLILNGLSTQEGSLKNEHSIYTKPSNFKKIGDVDFLKALPTDIRELGESLLSEVRNQFRGELKYYPVSGKYVETPDNFWTVKIQPRDKSLRITVRGNPESFTVLPLITLKGDMGSYSAFKIFESSQLPGAVSIIRQASQK